MRPFSVLAVCLFFSSAIAVAYASVPKTTVNDPTEAPTIDANCFVDAGDSLGGHADDCDAPIDAEATWDDDGTHLSTSPDLGGFGTRNAFEFPTSSSDAGRSFTLKATDGNGNYVTKVIDVL